MNALTALAYGHLDRLIGRDGVENVSDMILSRIADGEDLSGIAKIEGMMYSVLWKWIRADEGRWKAYRLALEARAEKEAHEALRIVDGATPEDVSVQKLRAETRLKLAAKWDKKRYGDEGDVGSGFNGGITIVIGDVKGLDSVVVSENG